MAGNPRPTKRARRSTSQKAGPSNASEADPSTESSASERGGYEQAPSAWSHSYDMTTEGQAVASYGIYATPSAQPPVMNDTASYPMNDHGDPHHSEYPGNAPLGHAYGQHYQAQPAYSLQQLLMRAPDGPSTIPQGASHIHVAGAPAQAQGVPAASSTNFSAIDPSLLEPAEIFSRFISQFDLNTVDNNTSEHASLKRKACDEDAEATMSAQHAQGQVDLTSSFLKGKGRAIDMGAEAADSAGSSAPGPQLSPVPAQSDQGQVNSVEEGSPKTNAEKAQKFRDVKGNLKLVINRELCNSHKVDVKVGARGIPEKKIFDGAIACLRHLKWERVQERAEFERERALFGANYREAVSALLKSLEAKDHECDDLRRNEQTRKEEIGALSQEAETLRKEIAELKKRSF